MYQVIKRDGRKVDFDLSRIANAITKAFDATETGRSAQDVAKWIADRIER